MTAFRAALRRFLRRPAFTRLLERCGIEPRRYWLLVDLFETLSDRHELAMLSDDYSVRSVMKIWCVLGGLWSVLLVVLASINGGFPAGWYLLVFLALTVLQLGVLLLPELAENLVNPVAGLTLAHQPVNGATWTGAKLAHLAGVVIYVVAMINGVPAVVGTLLPHAGWSRSLAYPLVHLLAALGIGVIFTLLCCSLFGWLVRFVSVRRLKTAAVTVQAIPWLLLFGFNYLSLYWTELANRVESLARHAGRLAGSDAVPGGLPAMLGAGTVAVAAIVTASGLRALSIDHLIRVSLLMHAGSARRRRWRQSRIVTWIARYAGGQTARAGFEYLASLIGRDWQARRHLAMQLPGVVVLSVVLLFAGREPSPFAPGFAYMHFLPHLLGGTAMGVCGALPYGNDHKAAWLFGAAPESFCRPFARGVHAALWLGLILVPHVFWLLVMTWTWTVAEAVLFGCYSVAVTSLYLGLSLKLIDNVPFGARSPATLSARMTVPGLLSLAAVVPAIGIQYVVFRSVAAVVVVTIVVGVAAWYVTGVMLRGFAARIRNSPTAGAPGSLFGSLKAESA